MGQYSDALRDKNTVLKPFIKDFPSLARPAFLAESERIGTLTLSVLKIQYLRLL